MGVVILLCPDKRPFGRVDQVVAHGVPDAVAQAVAEAFPPWRDRHRAVADLNGILRSAEAPSVVVANAGFLKPFSPPAGIAVPFEPQRLSPGNRTLRSMSETGVLATGGEAERRTPRSWLWRLMAVWVCLVLISAWWRLFELPWYVFRWGPMSLTPEHWQALLLPCVLALVFLVSMTLSKWYLVPGGVIVRRGLWFGRYRGRRFTPDDTFLFLDVVEEYGRHYWHAELWLRNVESTTPAARRRISDYERRALLAAWRSPLAPPTKRQVATLSTDW